MKARILAIVIGVCVLLGVASAAGIVSDGNSLVSKDYLYDVFFPQLKEHILEYATDKWHEAFGHPTEKLDQIGQGHMNALSPYAGDQWDVAEVFEDHSGASGGSISLAVGSGLRWTSGDAKVSGTLSDVTSGAAVEQGESLVPGHYYIAVSETAVSLIEDAEWQVEGKWIYTPPVE